MQQGATRQGCGMGTWLGATHRQHVVGYLPSPAPGLPITTGQPTHPRAEHSNPFSSFPLSLWKPSPTSLSLSSFSLLTLCSTCPRVWHSGASPVPSDAGQWPLLSHMRLHQLPLSSTCRHRPNPTCHRHDCARPVLYMRIQNIKVGNPKYATLYLLYWNKDMFNILHSALNMSFTKQSVQEVMALNVTWIALHMTCIAKLLQCSDNSGQCSKVCVCVQCDHPLEGNR